MKIYLYEKYEYLSKYKLFIMKPVIVNVDINIMIKSSLEPVPVENAPGSLINDVYSVNLIDSKEKPVRGIIAYKTKQGIRAYLSLIKAHCPYTDAMEEMLDRDWPNHRWVSVMPHKETYTQISPYIVNPYNAMKSITINKKQYYFRVNTGLPSLIYIIQQKHINGYDVKTMDYILIWRSKRGLRMSSDAGRRIFFDVRYNNQFRRLYDFNKIGNSVIDVFSNEGTAMAAGRDINLDQYSFIKIHFLVKNPGRKYMLEHWHESSKPAISRPLYLFKEHVSMSLARNFTVIDDPAQALSILSRVSNNIYLPKDKPAKPLYDIRYSSGDFLLGYPEVNGAMQ